MEASTRISDVLTRMGIPANQPTRPPVPFEQTDEYRRIVKAQRESALRKAGLHGDYAEADSPLGRECYERAKAGRGTYLHGTCGNGKSWAAACVVRLYTLNGVPNRRHALFITSKDLLDAIRSEWGTPDEGEAKRRAKTMALLALDDFGLEAPTVGNIQELTDIVNARYERKLPTVFTSNYRLGEFVSLWGKVNGERIVSRIAGSCEIVAVEGEDRRLQ